MKKLRMIVWLLAPLMLWISSSFAPVEHGVYVQLHPGSNKKIIFQIVPDKTYSKVVAHINFYSASNKRVGQEAFSITDDKDKYVRKDVCTSKTFKFSFDESVARVTIDYVSEGEIPGKGDEGTKGNKLNLPVSDHALAPVQK